MVASITWNAWIRPRWLAIAAAVAAVALSRTEASAAPCAPPTPACHLDSGKQLLDTDPGRAAQELLASYRLDERTDTLALYATALQRDHQYALALETWKRVLVFRDSELDAAIEAARTATGRKRAAARAAQVRARAQSEQAAQAVIELWPRVGRVRIEIPPGQQLTVSRGGVEVDPSHDVPVNAGRDELVFTRRDGSVERVAVAVAAGAVARIDAPGEAVVRPAPPPAKAIAARPAPAPEVVAARAAEAAEPEAAQPEAVADLPERPRLFTARRIGVGLVAAGVLAGGTAAAFGYLASRDHDDAFGLGCSGDGLCPRGPAADLAQRGNDRARIAQVAAIGAGVLAATGVTLWLVGRKKAEPGRELTLHIGPSSTAISGRF